MKKLIYILFVSTISFLCIFYKDELINFSYDVYKQLSYDNIEITKNKYYRDYDFLYLKNIDNFKPQNSQDITNIFYTVINSGQETFSFYCPNEYTNCIDDIKLLANDQARLSHINNFVHPYNSFSHIETTYSSIGEVTITINKNYTPEEIAATEAKVLELTNSLLQGNISDIEKVKIIHDYIINNSKYDSARSDYNIIEYKSNLAFGPLIEGYGICGGYSDAMQLFLEELNIKNYKVSSDNHVWNALYLDNQWYHLDLTWDDPVTSNNTDILEHNYFLISTDSLLEMESEQHNFNQDVYMELKQI